MGRLIALIILLSASSLSVSMTEYDKDLVRGQLLMSILDIKKKALHRGRDVQAIQYLFDYDNVVDVSEYPELEVNGLIRVFTGETVSVEVLLSLMALSTQYSLVVHPQADLQQQISINNDLNHIDVVVDYIKNKTGITVAIYHESGMIQVLPTLDDDEQFEKVDS